MASKQLLSSLMSSCNKIAKRACYFSSTCFPVTSQNPESESNKFQSFCPRGGGGADQNPRKIDNQTAAIREIFKQGMMGNIVQMACLCDRIVKENQNEKEETEEALIQLIHSFKMNHRFEEAFRVLLISNSVRVLKTIMNSSQVHFLNSYLQFLIERHQIRSALNLFDIMSFRRNTTTFEIIIVGFSETRGWHEECVEVVNEMLSLHKHIPGLNFYNKVIPFLCENNKLPLAHSLLKLMKDSGFSPDYLIYEALINCLCQPMWSNRNGVTVSLVKEMTQCGLAPSVDIYALVVNHLFCSYGFDDDAALFLQETSVTHPYPHNTLLKCFCNHGMYDEAYAYIEKMVQKNVSDFESWNILITEFFQAGMVLRAFETLNRAITSLFPDHSVCTENGFVDISIKKIRVRKKNSDDFVRLYSLAYQLGIPCNTSAYNYMLLALYELGRTKDILLLFSQMLVMGCCFNAEAYSALIHTMCQENKTTHCAHLLNLMISDGLTPNSKSLDCLLSYMASHSQLHMLIPTLYKLASKDKVLSLALYYMLIDGLWKEAMHMLISVLGRRVIKLIRS